MAHDGYEPTVPLVTDEGVQVHAAVATHERVAGVLVEHTPLPPTQVYAGLDADVLQAVWHVGAVHVPVAGGADLEAKHLMLVEPVSASAQNQYQYADPLPAGGKVVLVLVPVDEHCVSEP